MNRRTIACAMVFAGLWGCGNDRSTEGPGSETSGLAARILDSSGTPLAGVSVRVVSGEASWRGALASGSTPVLASGRTDALGLVRFELPDTSPVSLELDDTTHAGRLHAVPGSDTVRELRAVSACALRLAARVPGETISTLRLAGTGYTGSRQLDGTWLFTGVPAGTYTVGARTDSGLALLGRAILRGGILDTAMSSDVDSVLLEDFAGTMPRNRYGGLLGAGWWYSVTDAVNGGASTTIPGDVQQALGPCSDGTCLDMEFRLDPSLVEHFGLVGTAPDGSRLPGDSLPSAADFTKVTHVRFLTKGWGTFWFQLGVARASGGTTACHADFLQTANLAETEIAVSSLVCDASDPDFRFVEAMTWTARTDGHLTLGRIRLIGAGPREVFKGLRTR